MKAANGHYDPFTRVKGDTEHSFLCVLPLEPRLAAIQLLKKTFPLMDHHLLDKWAHQCATQTVVVIRTIPLLTSSISSITAQPNTLPFEVATENGKATAAILTFSTLKHGRLCCSATSGSTCPSCLNKSRKSCLRAHQPQRTPALCCQPPAASV